MTARISLSKGLVFAAFAGLAAPLFVGLVRPFVGASNALSLYAIAIAATYLVSIAPRPTRGLGAGLGLALPSTALWIFGGSPGEVAFLCAGLIGLMRSGWLCRDRRTGVSFARAFAIEIGLVGAGLWLGAWVGQGSFFPIAMGVWSFFLVQSAFALVGGPPGFEARSRPELEVDPFEAATHRARALLEQDGLG